MKFIFLTFILLTISVLAQAQLTINATSMAVAGGTLINTTADVNINASRGMGGAVLLLSGQNQALSSSNDLVIAALGIGGGGVKTINGNVGISNTLRFVNGIVDVPDGSNLVIGTNGTVSDYSAISYVNGRLNRDQTAEAMVFPVGKDGTFTPVTLTGVTDVGAVISIEAFNEPITGVTPPDNIGDNYSQNWFWELTDRVSATSFTAATITLPILTDDRGALDGDNYKPVVLHKDFEELTMNLDNVSLAANITDSLATAIMPAGVGAYFLGFELLTNPLIHNIITPNDDGVNDFLTIDNLSLYPKNQVTLIDRYGVEVYSSEDYVSPNSNSGLGDGEDFSFLSPGNYICILKYFDNQTGAQLTAKQTLSVIK